MRTKVEWPFSAREVFKRSLKIVVAGAVLTSMAACATVHEKKAQFQDTKYNGVFLEHLNYLRDHTEGRIPDGFKGTLNPKPIRLAGGFGLGMTVADIMESGVHVSNVMAQPWLVNLNNPKNPNVVRLHKIMQATGEAVEKNTALVELLRAPHWNVEQQIQWETGLSNIVTSLVTKDPVFGPYRDERGYMPSAGFEDMSEKTENDCDKMAVVRGIILQTVENEKIAKYNALYGGDKKPTNYMLATVLFAQILETDKGVLSGAEMHCAIYSDKTCMGIEPTSTSNPAARPEEVGPSAFKKFINGEMVFASPTIDEHGKVVGISIYADTGSYKDGLMEWAADKMGGFKKKFSVRPKFKGKKTPHKKYDK